MVSEEQILKNLKAASPLIRDAFGSSDTAAIIMSVGDKYRLHIDVIGKLGREVGLLLLGLVDPNQLYEDLINSGVRSEDAKSILVDINEKIFLPLREKIKNGVSLSEQADGGEDLDGELTILEQPVQAYRTEQEPIVPVMQVAPATQAPVTQEAPVPSYNLIGSANANPQPAATPMPASAPMPVAPMPTMRTMQHDIDALQHGQVPTPFPTHLEALAPAMPSIAQATPARGFQTASVPFTSAPQRPAPVQVPSMPVPPPPAPRPLQPQAPQEPFIQPSPSGTSTDPYREPI